MNRKARRQLQKTRPEEFEYAVRSYQNNIKHEIIQRISCLFCLSMHDKLDLKKEQIEEVVQGVVTHLKCANDKLVHINELQKLVKEEIGIEIVTK